MQVSLTLHDSTWAASLCVYDDHLDSFHLKYISLNLNLIYLWITCNYNFTLGLVNKGGANFTSYTCPFLCFFSLECISHILYLVLLLLHYVLAAIIFSHLKHHTCNYHIRRNNYSLDYIFKHKTLKLLWITFCSKFHRE